MHLELSRELREVWGSRLLSLNGLLKKHLELDGATVGILRLAFKPGTDDIRDSRALGIVKALKEEGAEIVAYDPLATQRSHYLF